YNRPGFAPHNSNWGNQVTNTDVIGINQFQSQQINAPSINNYGLQIGSPGLIRPALVQPQVINESVTNNMLLQQQSLMNVGIQGAGNQSPISGPQQLPAGQMSPGMNGPTSGVMPHGMNGQAPMASDGNDPSTNPMIGEVPNTANGP